MLNLHTKMGSSTSALADPEYDSELRQSISKKSGESLHEKIGIRLMKHCIKTLIENDMYTPDFFDFETHTTTKSSLTKDEHGQTYKDFVTVLNAQRTIVVIFYKVPCDIKIDRHELSFHWHATNCNNPRAFSYTNTGVTTLFNVNVPSQPE